MLADEGRVFQPRPAPPPRSARPARAGAAGRAPAGETLMMRSSRGVQLAIALDGTAFPRQSPVRAGGWRGARRNLTAPLILSATEQPRPGIPPLPRLRVGAGYRPLHVRGKRRAKPRGDDGEGKYILDAPEDRFSSSHRRKPVSIPWIPAFAGMTMGGAGMTTGWDRLAWNSLEKPGGDDGEREDILDASDAPFCRSSGEGA